MARRVVDADFDPVVQRGLVFLALFAGRQFARLDLDGDGVLAVAALGGRGRQGAVVEQHDFLEQVVDQVSLLGRRDLAQARDQRRHARIRRPLLAMGLEQLAQHAVDLVFADHVLQQVHGQAALVVVDIGLVFVLCQRQFLLALSAASHQVLIQVIAQEAPHLGRPHGFLHHHQRRILGQGFAEHGGAPRVAAH